jgi:hypothetical protein
LRHRLPRSRNVQTAVTAGTQCEHGRAGEVEEQTFRSAQVITGDLPDKAKEKAVQTAA